MAASADPSSSGTRASTVATAPDTAVRGTASSTAAHRAPTSRSVPASATRSSSSVRIFDAFARMRAAFSNCGSIAGRSRSDARRAGLISRFAISTANRSSASSTACASN